MVLIDERDSSSIAADVSLVGGYVPAWDVTEHPMSGALSDHRERRPVSITWEVTQSELAGSDGQSGPDHIAELIDWLTDHGDGPLTCVQVGLPTITSLAVVEFPYERSPTTGLAIRMTIRLREIRIATTRNVRISGQPKPANAAGFASATGAGQQQTTSEAGESAFVTAGRFLGVL